MLDTRHVMNALLHPSQNKLQINIRASWWKMNAGLVSRSACGRNRSLGLGVSAGDIHRDITCVPLELTSRAGENRF